MLRGLWGAGTEMALSVLVYNLKRAMKVLGNAEMRKCAGDWQRSEQMSLLALKKGSSRISGNRLPLPL